MTTNSERIDMLKSAIRTFSDIPIDVCYNPFTNNYYCMVHQCATAVIADYMFLATTPEAVIKSAKLSVIECLTALRDTADESLKRLQP